MTGFMATFPSVSVNEFGKVQFIKYFPYTKECYIERDRTVVHISQILIALENQGVEIHVYHP